MPPLALDRVHASPTTFLFQVERQRRRRQRQERRRDSEELEVTSPDRSSMWETFVYALETRLPKVRRRMALIEERSRFSRWLRSGLSRLRRENEQGIRLEGKSVSISDKPSSRLLFQRLFAADDSAKKVISQEIAFLVSPSFLNLSSSFTSDPSSKSSTVTLISFRTSLRRRHKTPLCVARNIF